MRSIKFDFQFNSSLIILLLAFCLQAQFKPSHQERVDTLEQETETSFKRQRQNDHGPMGRPSGGLSYPTSSFIVLMSTDSISMAQLPLIENGNLTVVYRLDSGNDILKNLNESEEDNEDEAGFGGERNDNDDDAGEFVSQSGGADAREFEQMPHADPTTSLGKSEWQQIAGGNASRTPEEIGAQQQPAQQTANTSDRKEEDVQDEQADGSKRPRRRRSRREASGGNSLNLLADGGGSNSIGVPVEANGSASNNGSDASQLGYAQTTEPRGEGGATIGQSAEAAYGRAQEDATATAAESPRNVTSAQSLASSHQTVRQHASETGIAHANATTAMKQGDKNSYAAQASGGPDELLGSFPLPVASRSGSAANFAGSNGVQFCDFDVHMSLGYAFAADSTGRIHRFRLLSGPSSSESSPPAPSLKASSQAHQSGMILGRANDDQAGGDSYNTIAAEKFEQLGLKASSRKIARSATEPPSANGAGSNLDGSQVSGNSNRVRNVGDDVTHEQSGANRQHPTISAGSGLGQLADSMFGTPDGDAPISGDSKQNNAHHSFNSNEAEPKIIWWRPAPSRDSKKRPTEANGALASKESEAATSNQATSRQLLGARQSNERVDVHQPVKTTDVQAVAPSSHNPSSTLGQAAKSGRLRRKNLRTEIAVDWLSNLLFVLDKYRLLVMDFDGNNELVLIDDFSLNNRPIDIKLDPINNFLFWLQVGSFQNTIYKLDLSVLSMPSATQRLAGNTLRLRQLNKANLRNNNSNDNGIVNFDTSEFVALISHHYAHPIITNLPRQTRLFTIDHKHSKIYVPFKSVSNVAVGTNDFSSLSLQSNSSQKDDAEVFAVSDNVTHLNSTGFDEQNDINCTTSKGAAANDGGSILAYNLDGTDVGPIRTVGEKSHISSLDDMQDFTVDSERGLLYWLTSDGKELFEEYKEGSSIYPAQHNLDGKSFQKLAYFNGIGNSQQPMSQKPRFSIRKIMQILSNSILPNRLTRESDDNVLASSLFGRHRGDSDGESSTFGSSAPYMILGIVCLVVVAVYLIYSFIFYSELRNNPNSNEHCHNGSISGGSSYSASSRIGTDMNVGSFLNSSTISRWITRPGARSTTDASVNRGSTNAQVESCDFESTNYDASNAIDEHYREGTINQEQLGNESLLDSDTITKLANLTHWPSNVHDLSNKLYVPVEVLKDEALSSIHRVAIDQLEIEKRAPLGEGHFGTVLQGSLKCTMNERGQILNRSCHLPSLPGSLVQPSQLRPRVPINSTASSSGHGSSSSTSCEFATPNSCSDPSALTNQTDYLTPRSHCTGTMSDYAVENQLASSEAESYSSYGNKSSDQFYHVGAKLKVAIKKLKDNASTEEKRDFLQEAKLLANFDHPNIVRLVGICLDRGSTLIVMELMLGGDLIRYMQENHGEQQNEQIIYDDLLKICLDIVNGCCYLEDLDYIHRDLAARNCLVSSRKREERVVKLADFGLARDIYKKSYYEKVNDSAMPLKWMAPECLSEQKFTKKSDVWSFGVVMWEVMGFCQQKPYEDVQPFFMKEHLASGARLNQPINCDDKMYKLMMQCWKIDPEKRPTFHECRAILIEIKNGG